VTHFFHFFPLAWVLSEMSAIPLFETKKKGKILDVVMWSCDGGIVVNGVEVKDNNIFYDVIIPFLPEEAVKDLEKYMGRAN